LTPFYPQNFKEQQAWDADGLGRWIKNPRQIRPLSPMPPLNLNDQQIRELIDNTWPVSQGEPH
jgi:cytochrome c2